MSDLDVKQKWTFGKRDFIFLAVVASVIVLLVLGTSDRTTKNVPSDRIHLQVTTRAECMSCHGVDGIKPQPKGHTRADQCFQCHMQPKEWHQKPQ